MSEHAIRNDIVQPHNATEIRRGLFKVLNIGNTLGNLQNIANTYLEGLELQYPGFFFNLVYFDVYDEGVGNNRDWYLVLHLYWTGPANPTTIPTQANLP